MNVNWYISASIPIIDYWMKLVPTTASVMINARAIALYAYRLAEYALRHFGADTTIIGHGGIKDVHVISLPLYLCVWTNDGATVPSLKHCRVDCITATSSMASLWAKMEWKTQIYSISLWTDFESAVSITVQVNSWRTGYKTSCYPANLLTDQH